MAYRPTRRDTARATGILNARDALRAAGGRVDPITQTCVCTHPAAVHSGSSHGGRCSAGECACRKYRPDLAVRLAITAEAGREEGLTSILVRHDHAGRSKRTQRNYGGGNWSVRASDLGTCRRELAYRNGLGGDLERDPVSMGAARRGRMIEDYVVSAVRWAYPWREFQVKVEIEGVPSPGFVDEYDPLVGDVTEYKSAGAWRWDQVGMDGPSDDHRGQAFLYAAALEREGRKVRRVRIVYVEADKLRSEVFTYTWDDTRRALAEKARGVLLAHLTMLDVAELTGELPERDRSGPSTDQLCRNCPFRSACWNIPKAQDADRSPESYTVLGPSPEDELVDETLAKVRAAYDAKNAATKAVDEVKALIVGLEMRRYGRLQIVPGGAGGPNWKRAHEAAVEYAEGVQATVRAAIAKIPADLPPAEYAALVERILVEHTMDFESVPVPKNAHKAPSVRPVRKATLEAEAKAAAKTAEEEAAAAAQAVDEESAAAQAAAALLAELGLGDVDVDVDVEGTPRPPRRPAVDEREATVGADVA